MQKGTQLPKILILFIISSAFLVLSNAQTTTRQPAPPIPASIGRGFTVSGFSSSKATWKPDSGGSSSDSNEMPEMAAEGNEGGTH